MVTFKLNREYAIPTIAIAAVTTPIIGILGRKSFVNGYVDGYDKGKYTARLDVVTAASKAVDITREKFRQISDECQRLMDGKDWSELDTPDNSEPVSDRILKTCFGKNQHLRKVYASVLKECKRDESENIS